VVARTPKIGSRITSNDKRSIEAYDISPYRTWIVASLS